MWKKDDTEVQLTEQAKAFNEAAKAQPEGMSYEDRMEATREQVHATMKKEPVEGLERVADTNLANVPVAEIREETEKEAEQRWVRNFLARTDVPFETVAQKIIINAISTDNAESNII